MLCDDLVSFIDKSNTILNDPWDFSYAACDSIDFKPFTVGILRLRHCWKCIDMAGFVSVSTYFGDKFTDSDDL